MEALWTVLIAIGSVLALFAVGYFVARWLDRGGYAVDDASAWSAEFRCPDCSMVYIIFEPVPEYCTEVHRREVCHALSNDIWLTDMEGELWP